MKHRTTPQFWKRLEGLPLAVQEHARRNFELLKADPSYPSLHFKNVRELKSVRIGSCYRALGLPDGGTVTWFWIGGHDDCERIIAG